MFLVANAGGIANDPAVAITMNAHRVLMVYAMHHAMASFSQQSCSCTRRSGELHIVPIQNEPRLWGSRNGRGPSRDCIAFAPIRVGIHIY
jgi:hypothetical protein